jgi:two-component system, LytTR family, response regulator
MSQLYFEPDHVTHLEADVNYTIVHYANGDKDIRSYTLKKYEAIFAESHGFFRAHRHYLINRKYIKTYNLQDVVLLDGLRLPIARRRQG